MLVRLGSFYAVLCLALFLGVQAKVEVANKAYQNVVVSFSSHISPANASELVHSMQQILNETSSVLQKAIGLRIGSVVFHLPITWDASLWENVSHASSFSGDLSANVKVESLSDSAFGKHPLAIQYSGCGVPGLEISIPDGFISLEESYPKGKILAREWLKYRYGVFDENGFHNDSVYPAHYTIAGSNDIHVTDCTFPEVEYYFKDTEGNNCSLIPDAVSDCHIHPGEISAENASSSLMFFHKELPTVDHICGEEGYLHNADSPNKHNLLCSYKSVRQVVELSGDLADDKKSSQFSESSEEIQYTFVQETPPRLVVAWQNTKSLNKQKNLIPFSIRKFLYGLPDSSKIALHAFKDTVVEMLSFSELTTQRETPLSSTFDDPVDPCASCAVAKAADVLLTDNKDESGTIVIIAASDPAEDNDLVEKLKNSKLCLGVIAFPGASKEGWGKLIEASGCSSFYEIPDSEEKVMLDSLTRAMDSFLPLPADNVRIKTIATDRLSTDPDLAITVPVDNTAETFTLWIFGVIDADNIKCLMGETEIKLDKSVHSAVLLSTTFAPQTEEVKCSLKYSDTIHLAQLQMTTKPGAYFRAHAWIYDTTPEGSTEQMPVIIYAKLNYGMYPIHDAEVKAVVKGPDGTVQEIILLDDGRGDPDITRNDGIYSRYFTQFEKDGDYSVAITVSDNGKQATFGKNGQEPCCGSFVASESFEMDSFTETFETSFHAISKKPDKGYKPSRIVDLKVDKLDLPNSVSLKWTAPGGEMDHGQATSYEFSMFCQHEDCDDTGVLPNWIVFSNKMKPRPKGYGKEEKVKFHFTQSAPLNITVYFAVKAVNDKLHSDLSNLVPVQLSSSNPQELTTPVVPRDENPTAGGPTAGSIIAYTIIAIAILVLIAGAIYFRLATTRRRRQLEELNTPAAFGNGNVNDSFSFKPSDIQNGNPMRRVDSFPVVLYTHDQIKDVKQKIKNPPLYRSDIAPKPWVSMSAISSDVVSTDRRSVNSLSVIHGECDSESNELKQLDDVSQTSEPHFERNSRF